MHILIILTYLFSYEQNTDKNIFISIEIIIFVLKNWDTYRG